jgi:futalosine hydrolase
MNILLVSSTELEVKPILDATDKITALSAFLYQGAYTNHTLSVLITGIGMTNTAMRLSAALAQNHYDIVIQTGIAGSYTRNHQIGTVLEIVQENYADLGAESRKGQFLDLEILGFPSFTDKDNKLYFNTFQNPVPSTFDVSKVVSNTVNLCSGTLNTIKKRLVYFPAEVENMEGAAFFQTCIFYGQRFYAFRAVSNYVETRNTAQWSIPLAVQNVCEFILNVLKNPDF